MTKQWKDMQVAIQIPQTVMLRISYNDTEESFKPMAFEGFETNVILKTLKDYVEEVKSLDTQIHPETILKAIAKIFNVTISEIESRSRKNRIVDARFYFANTARKIYNGDDKFSLSYMGKLIGRDHSTMIHYRRTYDNIEDTDRYVNNKKLTKINDKIIQILKETLDEHRAENSKTNPNS